LQSPRSLFVRAASVPTRCWGLDGGSVSGQTRWSCSAASGLGLLPGRPSSAHPFTSSRRRLFWVLARRLQNCRRAPILARLCAPCQDTTTPPAGLGRWRRRRRERAHQDGVPPLAIIPSRSSNWTSQRFGTRAKTRTTVPSVPRGTPAAFSSTTITRSPTANCCFIYGSPRCQPYAAGG
jgi:hypothetical protein